MSEVGCPGALAAHLLASSHALPETQHWFAISAFPPEYLGQNSNNGSAPLATDRCGTPLERAVGESARFSCRSGPREPDE